MPNCAILYMNTEIGVFTHMIELYQLEHLIAFHEYGTLSEAAEQLHISQPTLTRSMKKLEDEFGVSLFTRSKNKMIINENGYLALQHARKIWSETQDMVNLVRALDNANKTISTAACAPVPLSKLSQNVTRLFPEMAVSSQIKSNLDLINGLMDETYQLIVLPYALENDDCVCREYFKEKLFFALPNTHPKAKCKELYLRDMNGENMILMSNIGFWHDLVTEKMPDSRFLVQNERFDFEELVQSSILPAFATDAFRNTDDMRSDRKLVPVLDEEANATYYIVCLNKNKARFRRILG